MSPRLRFALALLALAGCVLGAFALLGVGVWAGASPEDQRAIARALRGQAAFLLVGAVLVVGLLGVLLARFVRTYVTPLRRLAADARLVVQVNPGHRLDTAGPTELSTLATAVNDLATRYQKARGVADARSAADRAELEADRDRLAALMSDLAVGVIVCTVEGQILLYNAAARDLFGAGPAERAYVGLGRSVFGVLDRDLFAHALDRIRAGAPALHTTATGRNNRLLQVRIAPVGGEPTGYVITLADVTRRAEAGHHRDLALRALSEGTRAPLAAIRAAVENVLNYPDMAATDREKFVEIVREETHRLSEHLESTLADSAEYLTDRWQLDDVRAADLLDTVARSVRTVEGVEVTVVADGDRWLGAETYPIAQAFTDLVRRLSVAEVELSVGSAGAHAAFDLRLPRGGTGLDEAVRRWSGEPRMAALLQRHDTEVWLATDARGPYVRLLLPWSQGATAVARPTPLVPASRPEFYDFDLFQPAAEGWDGRRLDELACTVFDTETTGLEPSNGDEIISIGAVRVVNGRLLRQETYEQLVDPRRSVPLASRRIHGIGPAMLAGQPPLGEVLPRFAAFAEDSVLIGHNVAFDLKFLALKEASTGVRFTQPVLDTLLLSPVAHPDHEDHSLEGIATRLGVNVLGRHTALGDALLTGEIFLRLLPALAERGVTTLGEAREAARHTQAARRSATLYKRY